MAQIGRVRERSFGVYARVDFFNDKKCHSAEVATGNILGNRQPVIKLRVILILHRKFIVSTERIVRYGQQFLTYPLWLQCQPIFCRVLPLPDEYDP